MAARTRAVRRPFARYSPPRVGLVGRAWRGEPRLRARAISPSRRHACFASEVSCSRLAFTLLLDVGAFIRADLSARGHNFLHLTPRGLSQRSSGALLAKKAAS